ncbi:hypothetical protein BJ138DRAFT_1119569 [Hygrophoropsis aurantiaca]|uniref:Uncharacterized protein n=1 Tax=Hygrophoropsis aurantiaca TaxID=72124 RepID=A0ACB7ZSZ6_9AGAM|nr:hypothetical protein BJ138DRAFT_1119569 [Hygrophoropsis aurantiaca]
MPPCRFKLVRPHPADHPELQIAAGSEGGLDFLHRRPHPRGSCPTVPKLRCVMELVDVNALLVLAITTQVSVILWRQSRMVRTITRRRPSLLCLSCARSVKQLLRSIRLPPTNRCRSCRMQMPFPPPPPPAFEVRPHSPPLPPSPFEIRPHSPPPPPPPPPFKVRSRSLSPPPPPPLFEVRPHSPPLPPPPPFEVRPHSPLPLPSSDSPPPPLNVVVIILTTAANAAFQRPWLQGSSKGCGDDRHDSTGGGKGKGGGAAEEEATGGTPGSPA